MRKRILSLLFSVMLIYSIAFVSRVDVSADNNEVKMVDGSYLTTEESSSGTVQSNPLLRGKYMMEGECSITRAGSGRIYTYGSTTANETVDYVAVIVYVDQYNEDEDEWEQIDAWLVEDTDTYFVATSKTLKVDKGYYYRVHASHYAGDEEDRPFDSANSATDGIWID